MSKPVIDQNSSLLLFERGKTYSYQPSATNVANKWELSAGGLPDGLTLNTVSGLVSGKATQDGEGTWNFGLKATHYDIRDCTFANATNEFGSPGHSLAVGSVFDFLTTGTLPAELSEGVLYFVESITAEQVKLSTFDGGAVLAFTDDGSGVHSLRHHEISDEVMFTMGVLSKLGTVESDDLTVQVRVEVVTGAIEWIGVPEGFVFGPPESGSDESDLSSPRFWVKQSDKFPVEVIYHRNGIVQDLPIATLAITMAEFETEEKIRIDSLIFEKLGTGETVRYRTMIEITEAAWASLLANYEEDQGTYLGALCEIECTLSTEADQFAGQLQESPFTITGNLVENDSFAFAGLPKVSSISYTAEIDLLIPTHTEQQVSLTRELTVTWDGSVYAVSSITGTSTGEGAEEDNHWQSDLTQLTASGDADGITLTTRVTTTAHDVWLIVVNLASCNSYLYVAQDGGDPYLGHSDPYGWNEEWEYEDMDVHGSIMFYPESGDDEAGFLARLNALTPAGAGDDFTDVWFDVASQQIFIKLAATFDIDEMRAGQNKDPFSPYHFTTGFSYPASVKVELVAAGTTNTPQRKTSETFRIRTERDLEQNT